MLRALNGLIAVGFCIVLVSQLGCAPRVVRTNTIQNEMDEVAVSFSPLQRSDYEVLGNVSGEGVVTVDSRGHVIYPDRTFGYIINGQRGSMMRQSPDLLAEQIAVYKAVSSIEGADALVFPRFERRVAYDGTARTYTVKVTAKAIRLKADR